jgi:UDP-hydrolysing UDP-N-acetyl-D-glucosamine 2-epimerase
MKVCFFIGSRANWGRLKSVVAEMFKAHEVFIIIGASGYKLDIPYPHIILPNLIENNDCMSMAVTTGLLASQIAPFLNQLKPAVMVIHGDRYECLGAAMAASYMNIPLAHTEGGEKTGTIDDKVRNSITALSDIEFVVTKKSAYGVGPYKVAHIVGSTALDGLQYSQFMDDYAVILHHPNTADPEDITPLIEAVESLDMPKVWVNPNVDAGSKAMLKKIHQLPDVQFQKDLPPDQYISLIRKCRVLIGNTSSMIKEGAFLGIPSVLVGNRQMGRETGANVVHSPMSKDMILKMIYLQLKHGRYEQDLRFGDGHASEKIRKVLEEVI